MAPGMASRWRSHNYAFGVTSVISVKIGHFLPVRLCRYHGVYKQNHLIISLSKQNQLKGAKRYIALSFSVVYIKRINNTFLQF